MKILGYDEEKELVAVDLPIDRIIAEGIDPWRLDLFDPAPVKLEVNGKVVNFYRLRDLMFEDWRDADSSGKYTVGIFDQNGKMALRAQVGHVAFDPQGETSISAFGFDEHFRQYLEAIEKHGYDFHADNEHGMSPPSPASLLVLNPAEGLVFTDERGTIELSQYVPFYTGEMLRERVTPMELPDELNVVFEQFGQWNPVIMEGNLTRALLGHKLDRITFLMHRDGFEELRKRYRKQRGVTGIEFKIGSTHYSASPFEEQPFTEHLADAMHDPYWFEIFMRGNHSVSCLYSRKRNEVCGPRIAFHDFGKMRTRRIQLSKLHASDMVPVEDAFMEKFGFNVIDESEILRGSAETKER